MRSAVSRSRSSTAARSATQSGVVNSTVKTWARGMSVSARNHRFRPVKCDGFRTRCSPSRRALICARRPPRAAPESTSAPPMIDR